MYASPLVNLILYTDSYKHSHFKQYPPGTRHIYSYIESRGGAYDETLFFGLQRFLMRYLSKPITMDDVNQATEFCRNHGVPFNRDGWTYIVENHGGRLPVHIRAVREGAIIPTRNVLVDIENTDPECEWLTSFLETALLASVWYPVTVATRDLQIKKTCLKYLEETGSPEGIMFMHNDFGVRGVSSFESAQIGGMAHLANFAGTDNIPAVVEAREIYDEPMAGFSVAAAEHSTITSWGREHEHNGAFKNMLDTFGKQKGAIISVVSDSYDIWAATDYWISQKEKLEQIHANSGARLVIRPDSGDPVETPVAVIERALEGFGFEINDKGYKVLPPYVRVIQGDGVNEKSIAQILELMKQKQISADNIVFGMGGQMLQSMDRDTLKFAMKCSAIHKNGHWEDVYKDPVTDPGKISKRGRLSLVEVHPDGSNWEHLMEVTTVRRDELDGRRDLLEDVFIDGQVVRHQTLADIRGLISREIGA